MLLALFSSLRLMRIQVVGDDTITMPKQYDPDALTFTKQVRATRGEIIDYGGHTLVTNDSHCDLVLQKAFFPEDLQEGNRALLGIYNALEEHGYHFEESIPITKTQPYVFTEDDNADLIAQLGLNVYATAENCVDKLIADYEIADSYTQEEKRIIAGMRYEMIARDFAYNNDMVLAEEVDDQTIIDMKELGNFYKGIDVIEVSERRVERGDILPHEIGTVGPIWAEEYDDLKNRGYALNDKIGRSGIEAAMETELRGQNGEEQITVKDGAITGVRTISATTSGQTVKLTVDGTYQLRLQSILENFLKNFQSINTNPKLQNVNKGAICVLNAKTGAVKGMATAPTYNLKDYIEDYDYVLSEENSPLVNRCTYGLYRPGSTFKTVTATAGLAEGIVSGLTTFNCSQKYEFYGGDYSCTGFHGDISMRRAIEVSCNSYFYELSRQLGIDRITEYAKLYGLGSSTGIETGDAEGYLCNPETFAEHGQPWYIGYVIQAGIGNQDCGMTPLQMAVVANTIANRGVRYKPYLVDSLYDYGSRELTYITQPTVAETIDLNAGLYDYIIEGMIDASHNVPYLYSLSNLGFDVAIKTGTPQVGAELWEQNSFFIGFAPADDPEIAFAGVIEGGEYSKYMIRDIILAYQECYGLNGVEPTATLPAEVRPERTTALTTAEETTTTSETTTTTAEPETYYYTQTTLPEYEPITEAPTEPYYPPEPEQPVVTLPPETTSEPEQQYTSSGDPPEPVTW